MLVSTRGVVVAALIFFCAAVGPAAAQDKPAPLVEGGIGYVGFIDEVLIDHLAVHGGGRVYVTPRIAIGPEIAYLNGPGIDRDWVFTGNMTVDLVPDNRDHPRAVVPYVIAGGGLMASRLQVGSGPYNTSEGAITAGGGLRIALGTRAYIAPELRTGWEGHIRFGVTIGFRAR